MKKTMLPLLGAALLALAPLGGALAATAQPAQAVGADGGAWTAYALRTQCRERDAGSHAQCEAAVRGILHGYRYGVVYLGDFAKLPEAQMKRIVVCINGLRVGRVVDDFLEDSSHVMDESLKRTPAEVALLGSLQVHQGCT